MKLAVTFHAAQSARLTILLLAYTAAESTPEIAPFQQSAYHSGQKCVSAEVKLQIIKERQKTAGRNDTKLIQELKRREENLLSVASIEVRL